MLKSFMAAPGAELDTFPAHELFSPQGFFSGPDPGHSAGYQRNDLAS